MSSLVRNLLGLRHQLGVLYRSVKRPELGVSLEVYAVSDLQQKIAAVTKLESDVTKE